MSRTATSNQEYVPNKKWRANADTDAALPAATNAIQRMLDGDDSRIIDGQI